MRHPAASPHAINFMKVPVFIDLTSLIFYLEAMFADCDESVDSCWIFRNVLLLNLQCLMACYPTSLIYYRMTCEIDQNYLLFERLGCTIIGSCIVLP